MRTAEFDFDLPPELIAQEPVNQRDQSRLLVANRQTRRLAHHRFTDLPGFLQPGDLLVINNSRVIRARLRGRNPRTGGRFELLLLREAGLNDWWTMTKPGRRALPGTEIELVDPVGNVTGIKAVAEQVNEEGHRRFRFVGTANILAELERLGEIPLPPYIKRAAPRAADAERYQTVFASAHGSLAAPTAGLHFTRELLACLESRGVGVAEVTLHVGLGTFAPVKSDQIADHVMHEERFAISEASARLVNQARTEGRRIIAAGTTSLRVLESVGRQHGGRVVPGPGQTRLFIHPPDTFTVVDALVTNFHLPRSTLLMLVSAFAAPGSTLGRQFVLEAYAEAIRERYRFFSYGDAMLIV